MRLESPPRAASTPSAVRDHPEWRVGLLRVVAAAGGVGLTMGAATGYFVGTAPVTTSALAALAVLMCVAFGAPRLPQRLRGAMVVTATYAGTAVMMCRVGFGPNVMLAGCAVSVAGMLIFDTRVGLVLVGLFALTAALVSRAFHAGLLLVPPGAVDLMNPGSANFGIRVPVVFGALSGAVVVVVGSLLERSERLSAERAAAYDELVRQQAEEARLREELTQREVAYRRASELELLGKFAGHAAHDLNNALLVILCSADAVRARVQDPRAAAALDDLRVATRDAAATIQQLRAVGTSSRRQPEPTSLAAEVRRAERLLARLLPASIQLELEVQDVPDVRVREGAILRALTNLALNARDAMRSGGKLSLRTRVATATELPAGLDAQKPHVLLEVQDTGAGMDAATRARLFEPFFTTKGESGSGLGLSSVREGVEAAGGAVTVDSEVGRGTRVRLFWPARGDARAEARPGREGTLLLVEDDEVVRRRLADGLAPLGFKVLEAADRSEALLAARRHQGPIQFLLTDGAMPGMPLLAFVDEFRNLQPGARVVVCSGHTPAELGLPHPGVDAFVPKPCSANELADHLAKPRDR
ncbi:MAG: response regulator [Deltaproteobacteria bacterium]|nr:response regulator [Deltaproteobacteria bacterium]